MTKVVELYNSIHVNAEKVAPRLTRRNMVSTGELGAFMGRDGLPPLPGSSVPSTPEAGK